MQIDKLARGVQAGINNILAQCYEQMVMGEPDAMARALGVAYVAETALGLVSQPPLLDLMMSSTADPQELEQALNRHDKSVKRQVLIANFLHRYNTAKAKRPSWPISREERNP